MPSPPRSLADLLSRGALGDLAAEAERRRGLRAQVAATLDPAEASHLVAASTEADGTLVLTMDSGAWAARVRYRLAGQGKLRVRVAPRDGENAIR